MIIVPETTIDDIVEYYESFPETLVKKTSSLLEEYPTLLAYLDQESNTVLLEEEKDLQWYIIMVCLSSILDAEVHVPAFTVDLLTSAEEQNWDTLQSTSGGSWKDRLDPFFDGYPQEDLLAFIEDMVQEDEESPVTAIGREVIFISAKSVVDCVFSIK